VRPRYVLLFAFILTSGTFSPPTFASVERALVSCAIRLPARAGQAAHEFTMLEVLVGSPDGSQGSISPRSNRLDQAGKRWRDVYPLAGANPVFLACHYGQNTVVRVRVPAGATACEFDYHYASEYDTTPDRVFCR
jgi:hypothetical protein